MKTFSKKQKRDRFIKTVEKFEVIKDDNDDGFGLMIYDKDTSRSLSYIGENLDEAFLLLLNHFGFLQSPVVRMQEIDRKHFAKRFVETLDGLDSEIKHFFEAVYKPVKRTRKS